MNYDDKYEIRIARESDIADIMLFIENNWKSGHIMARNRALFEYEFLEKDGTVNFVLAIDREKGTIEGLYGFLKASHDMGHLDIWGSIWKVLDGNMLMLGTEIIRRRDALTGCRCGLGVGDNPKTAIPILRTMLKRYTAKMKHYYMLSEIEEFKIAKIAERPNKEKHGKQFNVIKLNNIEEIRDRFIFERFIETRPYKDLWYINHRFFEYPIYKYGVYGIEDEQGVVNALIVLRNQEYQDRVAVRFVDYIGESRLLSGTSQFFEDILSDNRCEYVDFYCNGIEEEYIRNAGFTLLTDNDPNIIPNYFSPFCQQNIDIWVDSSDKNAVHFKADADQDRPN